MLGFQPKEKMMINGKFISQFKRYMINMGDTWDNN